MKKMEVFLSNCDITKTKKGKAGKNAPAYSDLTGDVRGRINNIYSFTINDLKTGLENYYAINAETLTQFTQNNDNSDDESD